MNDFLKLPKHVGIIMDGNGRWAKERGLPRSMGHNEGLKASKRIIKACADLGIPYVSIYTFSTENWRRAQEEVDFLMKLFKKYIRAEYDFYRENQIRIVHSGDRKGINDSLLQELDAAIDDTKDFTKTTVNIAFNYGGQDEILRAVNTYIQNNPGQPVSVEKLEENFDSPDLPPLDLIIRTGGEQRISNFFVWQSAYAELYFDNKLWPDWDRDDLEKALLNYQNRDRRFGGAK